MNHGDGNDYGDNHCCDDHFALMIVMIKGCAYIMSERRQMDGIQPWKCDLPLVAHPRANTHKLRPSCGFPLIRDLIERKGGW